MSVPAQPPAEARKAQHHRKEAEVEFARIVAFSDGVFAIAITLLVLAIEVPAGAADLWREVRGLEDDLFAYAISFAVIGKFWLSHHRFFGSLERFDNTLMGLNLFYLAWVVLVPFSSDLLGEYGENTTATIVYAANMVGAGGTFLLQILYSFRRGLVKPEARSLERRYAGPANFLFIAVFAISIPIAIVSPPAAQLSWLAVFLIGHRAADRLDRLMQR